MVLTIVLALPQVPADRQSQELWVTYQSLRQVAEVVILEQYALARQRSSGCESRTI